MTTMTWRRTDRSGPAISAAAALSAVAMLGATAVGVLSTGTGIAEAAPTHIATPAAAVKLLGGNWGGKDADQLALGGLGTNQPAFDPGSLFTVTNALGARAVWKSTDDAGRPVTGSGVTVALLDSGVSAVPGLDAPGKITYGPDFTEGDSGSAGGQDDFGHGTFMAGLIAANDPATRLGRPVALGKARSAAQEGLAPSAGLLSVKLSGADGNTSVQAVVAALSWVVAHKNDNGMNVRVVNLSFGAMALQPYQEDPLAAAAEAAWRAGIVVVASVGNDGQGASGIVDPAMDPFVIAVGASDPRNCVFGWNRPAVADFSSRGTDVRHADLLAPGKSLVSLRDPGSTIDTQNPAGLITGDTSGRLFRGSGTSEATSVVSGSVALLLQAHPELTPDQVKAILMATADPLTGANPLDAGNGQIDLQSALKAADRVGSDHDADHLALSEAVQTYPYSTGLDGIDVGDVSGSWDGARWNGARWNGARWNGARWNGARWNGDAWL